MARLALTAEQVLSLYPELEGFARDGQTDFNRVAKIIGSKNPKVVWAIINSLDQGPKDDRLAKLEAMLVR